MGPVSCVLSTLALLLLSNPHTCRKSDYKRVIYSKYVESEMEQMFQSQVEQLRNSSRREDKVVEKLYDKYVTEHKEYYLDRLQPSVTVGATQTIKLEGNRKKSLTLETVSKRRPLLFQIDDFLFPDECDHLIKKAQEKGLEGSLTGGGYLEEIGFITNAYDSIGLFDFVEVDRNGDSFIDTRELQKLFQSHFNNKMGAILVNDIMRKTYMDFDRDGKVSQWEWNSKNVSHLVKMLNDSQVSNPSSQVRFSEQSWLEHSGVEDEVLESIQDRLHKLTGLPLPLLKNSEDLQVVHYVPGGHYDCHLDSDPAYYPDSFAHCCHLMKHTENQDKEKDCSTCRFMTVLYYLQDPVHGGQTAFPVAGVDPYKNNLLEENFASSEDWCDLSVHCEMAQVKVSPKKGRAVLWYNHFNNPDTNWTGPVDPNSLHGGCAVHKGSKWIANNWINAGYTKEHDILSWARSEVERTKGRQTSP